MRQLYCQTMAKEVQQRRLCASRHTGTLVHRYVSRRCFPQRPRTSRDYEKRVAIGFPVDGSKEENDLGVDVRVLSDGINARKGNDRLLVVESTRWSCRRGVTQESTHWHSKTPPRKKSERIEESYLDKSIYGSLTTYNTCTREDRPKHITTDPERTPSLS